MKSNNKSSKNHLALKMNAAPNGGNSKGVPGDTPALIQGAPWIKPNGRYDTPPMVYLQGGNNQPYGMLLSKALEYSAFWTHHTDSKGNASTRHYVLVNLKTTLTDSFQIFF